MPVCSVTTIVSGPLCSLRLRTLVSPLSPKRVSCEGHPSTLHPQYGASTSLRRSIELACGACSPASPITRNSTAEFRRTSATTTMPNEPSFLVRPRLASAHRKRVVNWASPFCLTGGAFLLPQRLDGVIDLGAGGFPVIYAKEGIVISLAELEGCHPIVDQLLVPSVPRGCRPFPGRAAGASAAAR